MDALMCVLGELRLVTVADDFCRLGSAGLGEGGFAPSWAMAPSVIGLVCLMEVLFWLGRWYRVPAWWGAVALAVGCPLLLGVIVAVVNGGVAEGVFVGLLMGSAVAISSVAYWLPLATCRQGWGRP
jgi:hypothetical protein